MSDETPVTQPEENNPDKSEETPEQSYSVTTDPVALYRDTVREIGQIDEALNRAHGTIGELTATAVESAYSVTLDDLLSFSDNADEEYKAWKRGLFNAIPTKSDTTVKEFMAAVSDIQSEVGTLHKELKNRWMAENVSTAELDALRARRDEMVERAQTQAKMIKQYQTAKLLPMDIPLPPVPTAQKGKTGTSSSGGTKGVKVSNRTFLAKWDGMTEKDQNSADHPGWHEYPSSYDLSLLAFRNPFQTNVDILRDALKKAGWDGQETSDAPDEGYNLEYSTKKGETRTACLKWVKTGNSPEQPETDNSEDSGV